MGEELGNYVHQNMGEELGNYVHQNCHTELMWYLVPQAHQNTFPPALHLTLEPLSVL